MTCRFSTRRSDSPLARATPTYSCPSTSSMADRVLRIITAAKGRLRLSAGSSIVLHLPMGSLALVDVADRRQPAQPDTENTSTSTVASRKLGTEMPARVAMVAT